MKKVADYLFVVLLLCLAFLYINTGSTYTYTNKDGIRVTLIDKNNNGTADRAYTKTDWGISFVRAPTQQEQDIFQKRKDLALH